MFNKIIFFSTRMSHECKESISRWTEAQAEDIQLNPIIRLHCKSFIHKFCSVNLIILVYKMLIFNY